MIFHPIKIKIKINIYAFINSNFIRQLFPHYSRILKLVLLPDLFFSRNRHYFHEHIAGDTRIPHHDWKITWKEISNHCSCGTDIGWSGLFGTCVHQQPEIGFRISERWLCLSPAIFCRSCSCVRQSPHGPFALLPTPWMIFSTHLCNWQATPAGFPSRIGRKGRHQGCYHCRLDLRNFLPLCRRIALFLLVISESESKILSDFFVAGVLGTLAGLFAGSVSVFLWFRRLEKQRGRRGLIDSINY